VLLFSRKGVYVIGIHFEVVHIPAVLQVHDSGV